MSRRRYLVRATCQVHVQMWVIASSKAEAVRKAKADDFNPRDWEETGPPIDPVGIEVLFIEPLRYWERES